jgi:hypothetical protein
MVSAVHNGQYDGYQMGFGGWPGNSSTAIPHLDPTIGLVPWFYGSALDQIQGINASDAAFNGKLTPPFVSLETPLQWIGGAGGSSANLGAWAANLATSKNGLGILGTEWDFEAKPGAFEGLRGTGVWAWNHQNATIFSCTGS